MNKIMSLLMENNENVPSTKHVQGAKAARVAVVLMSVLILTLGRESQYLLSHGDV